MPLPANNYSTTEVYHAESLKYNSDTVDNIGRSINDIRKSVTKASEVQSKKTGGLTLATDEK